MQTICLRCGKLDLLTEAGRVRCPKCDWAFTRKRYDRLIEHGKQIVLHGIKYRIEYEAQISKHGKIVRRFALRDPTIVESAVGIIITGVLTKAAWATVTATLKAILTQLKRRRLKPRTISSDRGICAEDADLIYNLIGSDSKFAARYIGYSKDYVRQRKSPLRTVSQACAEEFTAHTYTDICENNPSIFVYSSQTGKRFHRRNCKALRPPIRRVRIKTAILKALLPCIKCKPV